jgi:hypothetical protein
MTKTAQTDRFGVPLKGWSLASLGPYPEDGECAVKVACATCGDAFYAEDGETLCAACAMPPADAAALRMAPAAPAPCRAMCEKCCFYPIAEGTTRCTACTRLYARLDANWQEWKERQPIAA